VRNIHLRPNTADDIDRQVRKILKGLGNPEPPLRLEDVRALQKLDKEFYSSNSDGILRETFSRLMVAGKQILRRPSILIDAIREAELKALYVPDRKMILLDETVPAIKQRWNESHEVIHSVLDWHGSVLLGDNQINLKLCCHERIEAEANYGAGRLLFLQEQFDRIALDSRPDFKVIKSIARDFGNSMTSTLWRFVEALEIPALGVVSQHPHYIDSTFNPNSPCRYFVRSKKFEERFSRVTETQVFGLMQQLCDFRKGGPIGNNEIVLSDDRGEQHIFSFEAFSNKYEVLTLILYLKPRSPNIAVPSAMPKGTATHL
jgi:Zn-dependent peptidase ImmA (M78 family)